MKRIVYLFVILLLISSAVSAGSSDETLTLVVGDALTIGFSSDAEGKNVLNAATSKLSGTTSTIWDSTTGKINTNKIDSKNDSSYATAYLEFYVFWDAFISTDKFFNLSLNVPDNFVSTGTTSTEKLSIVTDESKMTKSPGATVLPPSTTVEVVTNVSGLSTGSKMFIIAVDITKAKPNTKYTATLELIVEGV